WRRTRRRGPASLSSLRRSAVSERARSRPSLHLLEQVPLDRIGDEFHGVGLIRSFPLYCSLLLGQRGVRLRRPVAIAIAFEQLVGLAPDPARDLLRIDTHIAGNCCDSH